MRQIWKFQLEKHGENTVQMPQGTTILHLGYQEACITIWAEVWTNNRLVERKFHVLFTGEDFPTWEDTADYVGTTQSHEGGFVYHVYETR